MLQPIYTCVSLKIFSISRKITRNRASSLEFSSRRVSLDRNSSTAHLPCMPHATEVSQLFSKLFGTPRRINGMPGIPRGKSSLINSQRRSYRKISCINVPFTSRSKARAHNGSQYFFFFSMRVRSLSDKVGTFSILPGGFRYYPRTSVTS